MQIWKPTELLRKLENKFYEQCQGNTEALSAEDKSKEKVLFPKF